MGINVKPPWPPEEPNEALAFEHDLLEYVQAWAAFVLHGLTAHQAREVLRAETARLRVFSQARRDGL